MSPAGGSVRAAGLTAASQAASAASSAPAPNPAEGHSPRLLQELSGPLTGTGEAQPGSAVRMSTALQQATSAATSTTLNGVDVASFQHPGGAAIDWASVHGAGYDFAAIKATEGNYYTNKTYYASDAAAATAAGMYVAAYAFAIPNVSNGTSQADYLVNFASYKIGGRFLPVIADLEYDPYASTDGTNQCYGLSLGAMVTWISQFVAEIQKLTGQPPIIYTPASWWDTCTGNSTAFGKDMLWVPAYSAGTPGTLPAGWSTWTMWQYTSSGTVPGISGPVDLDYFSGGPQAEQTAVNTAAPVQIQTLNALAGQQVAYSATGLPPGLTMSSAGLITGTPTTAGSYQVTVTPSSSTAVLPASVSFTWEVTALAVGGEGTNGQLWVQVPQLGGGWHSLGGNLAAPPAVAAAPNTNGTSPVAPLFVITGTDGRLYLRSVSAGWQRLGPAGGSCLGGPAAVITGGTLTVACRGTNNALWENSATVPASGLPQFTTAWTNLGGVLTAGPAVAPVGGTLTFFARATTGRIYTRTLGSGFSPTPWTCAGAPAAALQAAAGATVFACQGTNHALWESVNGGAGWAAAVSLGGGLVGGPAVAAASQAPEFVAEGSNGAVWERTALTGWASLGGTVVGGVGAAALN